MTTSPSAQKRNKFAFFCHLIFLPLAVAAVGTASHACFMRSPQPVQVWLDHINVDVTDQVAVKTYNCTFKNPNPQAVVGGTCYMELEPGAQVDDMSVTVDGKEMKAEILDVDKAKEVFTDIVKNGGSPALLEYFGNQLITTQVPRIAPNGTVTVKLKYTTALKKRGDLVRMQMLNTNPKALMQPLKSASVTVNIKSSQPIKNIYSPTHEVDIVEKEGWDVAVEWKQENYLPKHPFVLYYQTAPDDVGAGLVAHRELDEDGAFMMMLSPTIGQGAGKVTEEQILPKDVVFCVDTSGSMLKGNKMEQARGALKYCVEHLRDGDRFNIVDFSTTARHFQDEGLVEVDEKSRAKALKYVEKLHARGGTAILDALDLSLKHLSAADDRLKMIVFTTDGLPTIGERDPEAILKAVSKKNGEDVRIFVFGEGFDVNTKLLDFLALDHRGEADYILPEESIQEKISRFFDRVGSPVMTDVEVKFDGLETKDVYPQKIPDVFKGEQVIVYGQYNGHGKKTVTVTGNVGGKKRTMTYDLTFPEYSEDDHNAFVPRLWAGKKVDHLLGEIRKQEKPDDELVNEVTYLAKRYGIITPYTSYLVTDDVVGKDANDQAALFGARFQAGRALPGPAGKPGLVLDSKNQAELRQSISGGAGAAGLDKAVDRALAESATAREKLDFADGADKSAGRKSRRSSLEAVRSIGSRTYYSQNGVWYDGAYEPDKQKNPAIIKVGSDAYFDLLKKHPRIASHLALGDVVLVVKGQWYRIKSNHAK